MTSANLGALMWFLTGIAAVVWYVQANQLWVRRLASRGLIAASAPDLLNHPLAGPRMFGPYVARVLRLLTRADPDTETERLRIKTVRRFQIVITNMFAGVGAFPAGAWILTHWVARLWEFFGALGLPLIIFGLALPALLLRELILLSTRYGNGGFVAGRRFILRATATVGTFAMLALLPSLL